MVIYPSIYHANEDITVAAKVDWAAYDRSLKQRGSIAFWLCEDVLEAWYAKPSGQRGAQQTEVV